MKRFLATFFFLFGAMIASYIDPITVRRLAHELSDELEA